MPFGLANLVRRTRYSPIGIEVDGRHVRAAQLARAPSARGFGHAVHAATEFRLPGEASAVEAAVTVRDVLRRRGFHGDRVALAAPSRILESDLLDLSDAKGPPREAVRTLLARATRSAATDLEVAFWPRRTDDHGVEAYAVALKHTEALRFVTPFEEAGLDVVSLACPAAAVAEFLARLVALTGDPVPSPLAPPPRRRPADAVARPPHRGPAGRTEAPTCTAVLRLGSEAHLVLLCSGRDVIYQRSLDIGGLDSVAHLLSPHGHASTPDAPAPPPTFPPALPPASPHAFPPTFPAAFPVELRAHLSSVATETLSTLDCVPRTFGRLVVSRLLLSGPFSDHPAVSQTLAHSTHSPGPIDPTPLCGSAASAAFDVALGLAYAEVRP